MPIFAETETAITSGSERFACAVRLAVRKPIIYGARHRQSEETGDDNCRH